MLPLNKITLSEFEKEFDQNHPYFLRNLSAHCEALTSQELRICSMIRSSMKELEIAGMLEISVFTVENHRTNIRKKLGFTHAKRSLANFLLKF